MEVSPWTSEVACRVSLDEDCSILMSAGVFALQSMGTFMNSHSATIRR